MFCKNCGNSLEPEAQFCRACGAKVAQEEPAPVMQEPVVSTEDKCERVRTVYVQPTYVQAPPPAAEPPKSNDMAIVGFVMAFVMPLVGLILSIIGYKNAKNGAPNRGLAVAGIIISSIYVAISVLSVLAYFGYFIFIAFIIGAV